ncbi:MAG TPA: KTSC domain-containing protein [Vitreimonas sp.]|uniref:KTSC domain-containing protein n=1 Tax=Vitreimonas sp. TaxID=3069702 RepID=UPI002D6C13ED|nr:KTSC domain-containing protein [Vitreimonas sp.]HYD89735.1 KTSC domain-containing protein [Vitreimonas sp.]
MPSTVIKTFAYDAQRWELQVTFVTGRRYVYEGVPPEVHQSLRGAFAKGSYFNREIRNRYRYRELA